MDSMYLSFIDRAAFDVRIKYNAVERQTDRHIEREREAETEICVRVCCFTANRK